MSPSPTLSRLAWRRLAALRARDQAAAERDRSGEARAGFTGIEIVTRDVQHFGLPILARRPA